VRGGVVASSGALFRAVRALPLHVAKEPLITGAELDAERGYQLGLVNRATEPGQALAGAVALAGQICASSPVSVRATLAAIAAQADEQDRSGWQATAEAIRTVSAVPDMQEGIAAFFERRRPNGWAAERLAGPLSASAPADRWIRSCRAAAVPARSPRTTP